VNSTFNECVTIVSADLFEGINKLVLEKNTNIQVN